MEKKIMNAQEYTVAYNKITSHKEFEDAQFIFEFVTQQCAILLVAASNPAEYMKSFWEAVDRKMAMVTSTVEAQKGSPALKRLVAIRRLRIQAMVHPTQFGFREDEGVTASTMPDSFYEQFM